MEAACARGLITDLGSFRSFLHGRLWTAGACGAVAAAAVCARAGSTVSATALFRSVEAELDARMPSPSARKASRDQGGHLLRSALAESGSPLLDALGRAAVGEQQRPHHPTAVGAVAAVAGVSPREAAEVAAYASVAAAIFAAQKLLGLDPRRVKELGAELAPEVRRLAGEAVQVALQPLSRMPSFGAPVLEYLAEEHVALVRKSHAS